MTLRRRFLLGFLLGQLGLFGFAMLAAADSIHVVLPGDTLSALGARFGIGVERLAAHNQLPSPDQLFVGQRLSIPDHGPDGSTVAEGASGSHTVASGETLGSIAARYGTTVDALMRSNNLASPNLIWAGIRLTVPEAVGMNGTDSMNHPDAVDGLGGTNGLHRPAETTLATDVSSGPRSIVIDLSDSRLYAYEGDALLQAFAISTGGPGTATPVGRFSIRRRLPRQDMSGPGYFAPDVPWVQYFHGSYAVHGTYWHNSFGQAVSHGCVNMRTPEAQWLYFWAELGTPVEVRW